MISKHKAWVSHHGWQMKMEKYLTPGTSHNSQNNSHFPWSLSRLAFILFPKSHLTGRIHFIFRCIYPVNLPNRITPRSHTHMVTGIPPISINSRTYLNTALVKTKVGHLPPCLHTNMEARGATGLVLWYNGLLFFLVVSLSPLFFLLFLYIFLIPNNGSI